ncbi:MULTISPECIES: hypothetical protein [Halococcus]|uniref:Fenitrothion hydrolase n=1 Tax=Halococcus salifodinae DSM 8989 TaxID=1227456 RepID=M0MY35_9EURY|nr:MULTISPECIES: hypothetical protein [Halococcus]EMA50491.1 hypothetical protein C450_14943 [Halococcus salifodinae DSM 8989]
MKWRRSIVTVWLALVGVVGVASGHQVANSRFAAPIPLTFLFGGAGVTVAATALWLGVTAETVSTARAWRSRFRIPDGIATGLRYGARAVFFAGFLVTVLHGLLGPQVDAENFATVFTWAVWLKGVGLLSILVGSPWRVLSPWRTLYDGLVRLEGREIAAVGAYPSWLGHWPAFFGFVVGIGIVENLTVIPRSPAATAVIVAGYAAAMVLGGVAFGNEWFRHADALSVLYRLFGRVAPVGFVGTDGGYRLTLRPPWAGCTQRVRDVALVAFVVATVYTVSFDGFTSTATYQTVLFDLRDALASGPTTSVLVYAVGLCGFVAVFVAVSAVMASVADESGAWRETALAFAPTVLPIAAAYEVAHNYPFVIENVGRLAAIGWSITVAPIDPIDSLEWLTLQAFWGSQVLLIVVGHVIAVVAAHHVALDRYGTLSRARRTHLPLVVLMVGYTVLSLWIISRPVVA